MTPIPARLPADITFLREMDKGFISGSSQPRHCTTLRELHLRRVGDGIDDDVNQRRAPPEIMRLQKLNHFRRAGDFVAIETEYFRDLGKFRRIVVRGPHAVARSLEDPTF